MMQQTSLDAYKALDPETLCAKQREVYNYLLTTEANNKEISEALDWSINTVTPRVLELRELGYVILAYTKTDRTTGRQAHSWKAREAGELIL